MLEWILCKLLIETKAGQNTNEKKPRIAGFLLKLVGERGFEPPTHWSQTSCATKLRYSPNWGASYCYTFRPSITF